jgi:glucose/arabinose dehydrogenase
MVRRLLIAVATVGLTPPAAAQALTLEPLGTYSNPAHVAFEPRNLERAYVVELGGVIRVTEAGTTSTFLDLNANPPGLVLTGGERGLFSMAFAPDYESSGRFYVFYSGTAAAGGGPGDLHIDEFTAGADPAATLASRRPVLAIGHSAFDNHNGGQLQFGPDGFLYAATGDGGGGGDPLESAQDTGSLLGKILRLDPRPDGAAPYTVPGDNPFVGGPGADEVWSFGLRNPWRFSFDRATGDLLIGDVGQAAWEEVNYDPYPRPGRGVNFGWDCREGPAPYEPEGCVGLPTDPIFAYANPTPGAAAITGGYVVRDPSLGDLYGRYLYADVYQGVLRSLVPGVPLAGGDRSEGIAVDEPISFGQDACGRVYVTSLGGDQVFRLVGDVPLDCAQQPPPCCAPLAGGGTPLALPGRDVDPPETRITRGPRGKVGSPRVAFRFAADERGAGFHCRLDSAAFKPCSSPKRYAGLDQGRHRFRVRAVDPAGNLDPTPTRRRFEVRRRRP